MAAAAFILLGAAAFAFLSHAYLSHLDLETDPVAREFYEDETRSYGWRIGH